MPSVGPELPQHLAKRKRSIDDDEGPNSPPHKVQAAIAPRVLGPAPPPAKNPDELDVGDSSEDDYGPSVQPPKPTERPGSPAPAAQGVDPTLPPSMKPEELDVGESSEDDYGPSFQPPKPTAKGPSAPPPPAKRVLGPALPPAYLSERPPQPAGSNSDSDDDYGPSPPPAPCSAAEASLLAQRQQEQELASKAQAPAKPQRDDWMLVPPSDSDWSSRVDPTKLKNRKFASGKGSKAPAEKGGGISAIWTETPEQKRQRLEDEVLGRKDAATSSSRSKEQRPVESKEDEETARMIQEYNDRNRNRSLYDEHKGQTKKEEEDDPSKRGFDREKDMALGGRIGHVQKKDMLAKAADFGSRFQKGRYL